MCIRWEEIGRNITPTEKVSKTFFRNPAVKQIQKRRTPTRPVNGSEMEKAGSVASALVLFFPPSCANFWACVRAKPSVSLKREHPEQVVACTISTARLIFGPCTKLSSG